MFVESRAKECAEYTAARVATSRGSLRHAEKYLLIAERESCMFIIIRAKGLHMFVSESKKRICAGQFNHFSITVNQEKRFQVEFSTFFSCSLFFYVHFGAQIGNQSTHLWIKTRREWKKYKVLMQTKNENH